MEGGAASQRRLNFNLALSERYNLISYIRYVLCIMMYILKKPFREERRPRAIMQGIVGVFGGG